MALVTTEERARWLIDFATRDLRKRTEPEWQRLAQELLRIAVPWTLGGFASSPPAEPIVRAWQRWLRAGLAQLQHGEDWSFQLGPRRWMLRYSRHGLERGPHWKLESLWREATHVFRDEVAHILADQGPRFRLCPYCNQPFIARRRQIYCGPTCSQTSRTRQYRQRHREVFNRRRRDAYARRHPPSSPSDAPLPTTPARPAAVERASQKRRR